MNIYGKTRDYYDSAKGWHSEFHWNRPEPQEYSLDRSIYTRRYNSDLTRDQRPFVVGFCGKTYTGYNEYIDGKYVQGEYIPPYWRFIYTELKGFEMLNFGSYFLKYKTPYYYIEQDGWNKSKLHILPNLDFLNFQTQIDPYTAHSMVEQFLTNELANENQPIQLIENEKQVLQRLGLGDFRKCKKKKNTKN